LLAFVLSKLDQICLANSTGQGQVRLLIVFDKDLQSDFARVIRNLVHGMDNAFDNMLFAPNSSRDRTSFIGKRGGGNLILARALDRRDIEAEKVASFECARNVEIRMALEAGRAGTFVVADPILVVLVLAQFTNSFVPRWRYLLKALGHFELLRVAESDFRRPDSTIHMNPVIASSSFQRLSWQRRSMLRELLASVFRTHSIR
jgi:hypothetical protein